MGIWPCIIAMAIAAYLIGAIPFGFLIARAQGIDIRTVGSGNIGATNVFRSIGKGWGILTFIGDALKGFLAVWLLPLFARHGCDLVPLGNHLALVLAAFAITGHNWPIYLGFQGGKGIATSAGALIGVAPLCMIWGISAWLLLLLVTRYVSVASIGAAISVAASCWLSYGTQDRVLPATLTVLAIVAIWRHRGNIQRLSNGIERRVSLPWQQ